MPHDLRPGVLGAWRVGWPRHWTAPYLWHRGRQILWKRVEPTAPSLTAEATSLLARLLRPTDRGIEWGSGNSTRWFASRTRHLVSLETQPEYYARVKAALAADGLTNVDYRLVLFADDPDESVMHEEPWVRVVDQFPDESFDYALVDSSPRGCLCHAIAAKIRLGGLLVLDNANWYIPPPNGMRPTAPGSVEVPLGFPGSRQPNHVCWPAFLRTVEQWRACWTSDGVQMTLVLVKT